MVDWKAILGSAYSEGMTDEEAQAKFNELYMPRADHDREIQKNKTLIDQYTAQIAENKRKQREQMSESEKAEAERKEQWDAMVKKNQDLERTLKISELAGAYMERGFDKDFATETATAMYDGDNATVLSNEKIFADKREASLKSAWEKEYQVNPPAGNGSGKVDLSKQIAEAQERGDMVALRFFSSPAERNECKKIERIGRKYGRYICNEWKYPELQWNAV